MKKFEIITWFSLFDKFSKLSKQLPYSVIRSRRGKEDIILQKLNIQSWQRLAWEEFINLIKENFFVFGKNLLIIDKIPLIKDKQDLFG